MLSGTHLSFLFALLSSMAFLILRSFLSRFCALLSYEAAVCLSLNVVSPFIFALVIAGIFSWLTPGAPQTRCRAHFCSVVRGGSIQFVKMQFLFLLIRHSSIRSRLLQPTARGIRANPDASDSADRDATACTCSFSEHLSRRHGL